MQYRIIFAATLAIAGASANPARPQITKAPRAIHNLAKRQQPGGGASSVLDAPMTIAAGESFDGGNAVFDRGVSCTGQAEGGDSDAVFILEKGASLSNVVIGPNQIEGVHCNGGCTITNVWWDAVCEDAFSIKKQADGETTTINGGGAKGAQDKVIQHNGGGTVEINDFTVSDFGKLYRSCGNCAEMPARHVKVTGGSATNGDILVGINTNKGDTSSISGVSVSGVKEECVAFEGVAKGSEPSKIGPCEGNQGGGAGGDAGSGSAAPSPTASSLPSPSSGGGDDSAGNDGEQTGGDKDAGDKDSGDADGGSADDNAGDADDNAGDADDKAGDADDNAGDADGGSSDNNKDDKSGGEEDEAGDNSGEDSSKDGDKKKEKDSSKDKKEKDSEDKDE